MALRDHPFGVEAFFEHSIVLAYAVPTKELLPLIPSHLQLDTFNSSTGFVAAAIVKVKNLRPKGFPEFLGNDLILIGYRIFVRYTNTQGKKLRGLYILKSETDSRMANTMGNVFTRYNFSLTDVSIEKTGTTDYHIRSSSSNLNIQVAKGNDLTALPEFSPFQDWKTAKKFAGPLPFSFTWDQNKKQMLTIEGKRENWTPQPLAVHAANIGFLNNLKFKSMQLANAFIVEDVPYYWKKGVVEKWQ